MKNLWHEIVKKNLSGLPLSKKKLLRIKFDKYGNMIKVSKSYQYARKHFGASLKEFERKKNA